MAKALIVAIKPKSASTDEPYTFPKPDGWDFQDDQHAKDGEYAVVKVKADGDNLQIVEFEGIPVSAYDDDSVPLIPDMGDTASGQPNDTDDEDTTDQS